MQCRQIRRIVLAAILMATGAVGASAQSGWVPIIGAESPNGGAHLLKRFDVAPGSVITGVKFVNNDARSVFPNIVLVRGPLKALSGAAVMAEARNAGSTGEHRVVASFPPTYIKQAGEVYVAVTFPPSDGVHGIGDGDGIIGTPLAGSDPTTSYFVSRADGAFGALEVDLRMALVFQSSNKATFAGDSPTDERPLPTAIDPTIKPNPFNPVVTIEFGVITTGSVELMIYDTLGRRVRTLVRETLVPGSHQRQWDGRDDDGRRVASGIYISKLRVGSEVFTQKLVMTK